MKLMRNRLISINIGKVLRQRSNDILGLGFMAALIGSLIAFSITPIYRAEVKLLVYPDARSDGFTASSQGTGNFVSFYQTQYEIITSRSIADSVIEKLKLEEKLEFINALPNLQSKDKKGFSLASKFKKIIPDYWELGDQSVPSNKQIRDAAIDHFHANLYVRAPKSGQVINIAFESTDASLAAQVTNAIAEAYIEKDLENKFALDQKSVSWLMQGLSTMLEQMELERDAEMNQKLYRLILSQLEETNLAVTRDVINITVVDAATPPLVANKPNKKLIIVAAIIAGLFLGVLLSILHSYLENTFRDKKDTENIPESPLADIVPTDEF